MASTRAAIVLLSVVAAVQAGKIKLTWKDCGDASTHGKVSGLKPDEFETGAETHMDGSGTITEEFSGGTFEADVSMGPFIKKVYKGDICKQEKFDMPMGLGHLTLDGLSCPVKPGPVTVGSDIYLTGKIPAALARATIQMKGTATNGDKLLCLEVHTGPAEEDMVNSNSTVVV